MSKVLAVLCSDIHLTDRAPVARSAEPNWYDAMSRPLNQILQLSRQNAAPLVIAGDIFDFWKSSPELINFAIDMFGQFIHGVFAVPGQHDLPNHSLQEIHRSAFWTLVRSGKVQMLRPNHETRIGQLALHGFPWGVPIKPITPKPGVVDLAVIHAYIWMKGHSYPGANEEANIGAYRKKIEGYTASVWGDNHKGFTSAVCNLMNCGTLMRRKADEIDYHPHVGLLHDTGTIETIYLDTSLDKFLEEHLLRSQSTNEDQADVSSFIDQLKRLAADPLDFREAVTRALDGESLDSPVRRITLQCLESPTR